MRTRAKLAAVVAVACLAVGGLTVASAAQLSVSSGGVSTADARPCLDNGTVQATRTGSSWAWLIGYDAVTLALPTQCQGSARVVEVSVHGTTGQRARVASGTRTGLVASTRVDVSPNYGGLFGGTQTLSITIDGWSIPVSF